MPDGSLDLSAPDCVSESDFERWTRRVTPQVGDVVFTYEATLHRYALIPEGFRGCLGRRTALVRVDSTKADPRYIYFYFRSPVWRQIVESNVLSGATVDRIPLVKFPDFPVMLPPLADQLRIADALDNFEKNLGLMQKQIKLLEEAARLIYAEWFIRLRFPGHEKAKTSGSLPDGWCQESLGQRIELNYGKSLKESDRLPGEVPVFGSSGIVGSHATALSQGPGIVVGRKGNVGSIFYSPVPFFAIDTVYFIRPEQTTFFLLHTLQRMNFISSDAAVPGLNRNYAYSQPVVWPSDSVLSEFEATCAPIYEQITTLEKQITQLRQARDLLLPRLISGQLRL